MEEITEEKSPEVKEVEEETSDLYGKSPAEITATRGRLIRKIKKEIKKIKEKENTSEEELKAVEELERRLNDLLQDHKAQLGERYDKEFIKQKADLKSLITVLPKAVGLSAKMVANCVSELQEAKTNKAKIFKSLELLKSVGLFAATPVIYTVKFIANHWYLIFLLLLLLKLPKFNWDSKGREHENPEPQMEPAPEYETEPVTAPDPHVVIEPEREREPGYQPQPERPRVPGLVPKPGLQPVIGPEPQTDTGTGNPVVKPEPVVTIEEQPVIEIVPELEGVDLEQAQQVYEDFFQYLKNGGNQVIIAEKYPEITYVHNAQEFIDYVKSINPYINIDASNALRIYESGLPIDMNPEDMHVYWINSGSSMDTSHYFETTKAFAEHILSGEEPALTAVFNQYVNGGGSFSIPLAIQGAVERFAESLGISVPAAFVLFLLYKGAQYGFSIPTGGVSLLLPG